MRGAFKIGTMRSVISERSNYSSRNTNFFEKYAISITVCLRASGS